MLVNAKRLMTVPASGSHETCMGLSPVKGLFGLAGQLICDCCLGCADSSLFGAEKAVLRPVACDQVRGALGRGQGTETLDIKVDDLSQIVTISKQIGHEFFNQDQTFWRGHGDAEWYLGFELLVPGRERVNPSPGVGTVTEAPKLVDEKPGRDGDRPQILRGAAPSDLVTRIKSPVYFRRPFPI